MREAENPEERRRWGGPGSWARKKGKGWRQSTGGDIALNMRTHNNILCRRWSEDGCMLGLHS